MILGGLGVVLGDLGAILDGLGAVFGGSWGVLRWSWGVLGRLGAILGGSWGLLGRSKIDQKIDSRYFLVVNFFGFWIIARYPTVRLSRKLEEILPTGLPDLPKPLRTNIHLRKP